MKLSLGDLNPSPCLSHLTSTYIYEMIITPKVCSINLNFDNS